MLPYAIKALAAGAAGLALSAGAAAAVTYHYTGNPFDQGEAQYIGNNVTATVTFNDSVIGYTGVVDASSVLSWAIRIAQIPGSEMGSATGAVVDDWPLYFVFDGGAITAWQVLARPAPLTPPEIYTMRNAPNNPSNPTADYFTSGYGADRFTGIENQPGVWAIPEPGTYLLMLGGLAMLGAATRHRRR
jgi:hypothetical protein